LRISSPPSLLHRTHFSTWERLCCIIRTIHAPHQFWLNEGAWHSSGLHNNISIMSKIQMQFMRNLHAARIQKNIYNHTRYQRSSP
jgi:hypothetical protein